MSSAQERHRSPSLAVDAGILRPSSSGGPASASATAASGAGLEVLMIRRGHEPFKGKFAFPGGFVDYGEDPRDAVLRELREETNLHGRQPHLVGVYGAPKRDPRKHVVSVFYRVQVDSFDSLKAGDDASHAEFVSVERLLQQGAGELAFDHFQLLQDLLHAQGCAEHQGTSDSGIR